MAAKKTIGIIAFDNVPTGEVTGPIEVFRRAIKTDWFDDWQVVIIGIDKQPAISTLEGIVLSVDHTIYDAVLVDALIVPGGGDTDKLLDNKALSEFIKNHAKKEKWLSSNCSGAFLLGQAGVLDGMQATTWSGGEKLLQQQFPKINVIADQPVVIDNRRLTSNGGLVSYQAALVLLAKLTSLAHAHEIFKILQMNRLIDWSTITESVN